MPFQIKKTADGSDTILIPGLEEHYHSVHGAIQEAMHVFINAGLKAISEHLNPVNILEVGLGTGLNCFLTFLENQFLQNRGEGEVMRDGRCIHYTAIEAYPLDNELIFKLNYLERLNESKSADIFTAFHHSPWNQNNKITEQFELTKLSIKLADYIPVPGAVFDLIYFDAFGPKVQPEMWTKEAFEKIYSALKPGGILVTYCAKGEVKRTLKSLGFKVETLPGPPGKREMTRGIK